MRSESPLHFGLSTTGQLRFLKITLTLLTVITGTAASGYEFYGPRWYEGWEYRIDSAGEIQDSIQERTTAISEIFQIDHISTTTTTGGAYDKSSQFYYSADFSQSLIYAPEGVNYSSFAVGSATENFTLGRAHLWWIGEEIVEVDIQIDPTLDGWPLTDVLDHEILHGLGCNHSNNPDARSFGESESVWGVLVPNVILESGENYDH